MDSYFLSPRAKKAVRGAEQRRLIYKMKDAAQERLREQETKTMTEETTYNEAPASVSIKAYSENNFDVMVTIRDVDTSALMGRMKAALGWLEQNGFKPTAGGHSNGASTNGSAANVCPIHSVPMKRHEKNGGVWLSHKAYRDDGGEYWCKGK